MKLGVPKRKLKKEPWQLRLLFAQYMTAKIPLCGSDNCVWEESVVVPALLNKFTTFLFAIKLLHSLQIVRTLVTVWFTNELFYVMTIIA